MKNSPVLLGHCFYFSTKTIENKWKYLIKLKHDISFAKLKMKKPRVAAKLKMKNFAPKWYWQIIITYQKGDSKSHRAGSHEHWRGLVHVKRRRGCVIENRFDAAGGLHPASARAASSFLFFSFCDLPDDGRFLRGRG
jgi:hypothetical protein